MEESEGNKSEENDLIFNSNGMSPEMLSNTINNAVSSCDQINKFCIQTHIPLNDLSIQLTNWLREITQKKVKEISLEQSDLFSIIQSNVDNRYQLPQSVFNNSSLMSFKIQSSLLSPEWKVNWVSLKSLSVLDASLPTKAIADILSGCPLLHSLEISCCSGFNKLLLISQHLKKFILDSCDDCIDLQLSCPNVEILDVVSQFPFKRLNLGAISSCIRAQLNFSIQEDAVVSRLNFVKKLFLQLSNVDDLHIGPWLLMVLSRGELLVDSPFFWNSKCLTLTDHFLETKRPGLQCLLPSFPKLEKLIIWLEDIDFEVDAFVLTRKKFSNSVVGLSHLKTVEIIALHPSYGHDNPIIEFAEFVLKNATKLEEIVLHIIPDDEFVLAPKVSGTLSTFALEVSHRLSRIPHSSTRAIIKVANY